MAYILPTFNLTCDVYSFAVPPPGAPRLTAVPCQLRAPSPNYSGIVQPSASQFTAMCLMVAAGTDLRDGFAGAFNTPDYVEVPAGTGRIYRVQLVDDIGKGFANEHRFCVLVKVTSQIWPVPIP